MSYVQTGDVITVTAATGGAAKKGIYVGTDRAGVYQGSATGGALVAVALEGVHEVAKAAGAGTAITVLGKVYSTATGAATPATGVGNVPLGVAVAVAATGDTTCKVKLAGW